MLCSASSGAPVGPGPCVSEFIQLVCRTGGRVPCEALQQESVREPTQLAQQEAACQKARANPVFMGRTQMALTLADRLLGNGKPLSKSIEDGHAPAFHADKEIEFDLRPDSFNASEISELGDPQLEEFFEAILEDPDLKRSAQQVPPQQQNQEKHAPSRQRADERAPMLEMLPWSEGPTVRARGHPGALQPPDWPTHAEDPDPSTGSTSSEDPMEFEWPPDTPD